MPLPDIIIGGVPKAGTTSVFAWLADHPDVIAARRKEPHFFVDRGHPLERPDLNVHDHGLGAYERCFPATSVAGRRLEASTHYLFQESAPEWIGSLDPIPHVVFILREPVDRLYSSYHYSRHNAAKLRKDVTLERYVGLSETDDPRQVANPGHEDTFFIWRNDVAYGRYAEWLDRWVAHIPRDLLHVYLFEDLQADTMGFIRRFARDIGLASGFYEDYDFPRLNTSVHVPSQLLHRVLRRTGQLLAPARLRERLRDMYFRSLPRKGCRPVPDDDRAVLARLRDDYRPHNVRLAEQFGLDLSSWHTDATPSSWGEELP